MWVNVESGGIERIIRERQPRRVGADELDLRVTRTRNSELVMRDIDSDEFPAKPDRAAQEVPTAASDVQTSALTGAEHPTKCVLGRHVYGVVLSTKASYSSARPSYRALTSTMLRLRSSGTQSKPRRPSTPRGGGRR